MVAKPKHRPGGETFAATNRAKKERRRTTSRAGRLPPSRQDQAKRASQEGKQSGEGRHGGLPDCFFFYRALFLPRSQRTVEAARQRAGRRISRGRRNPSETCPHRGSDELSEPLLGNSCLEKVRKTRSATTVAMTIARIIDRNYDRGRPVFRTHVTISPRRRPGAAMATRPRRGSLVHCNYQREKPKPPGPL